MPTRRTFLTSLVSRPASAFSGRRTKTPSEPDASTEHHSSTGPHQFGLRTILLLVTILCAWLGLLRADLRMGLFFGCVAAFAIIELYRGRIRTTLGDSTYSQIATALRCAGGALAGAFVGAIGGFIAAIVLPSGYVEFGTAIRFGIGIGIVLGVVYPRIAMTLILFVPAGG